MSYICGIPTGYPMNQWLDMTHIHVMFFSRELQFCVIRLHLITSSLSLFNPTEEMFR
jgi:hypothetical protein